MQRIRDGWLQIVAAASVLPLIGCAVQKRTGPVFPPAPVYAADHRYTLDELIEQSLHHNASLDVARWEAEAVQGLVDQVKALWLPQLRYNFAAILYNRDLDYEANAFNLVKINVPISGDYDFINALSFSQIIGTGGKRTSGLKQARMFAAIKKLDVLRQRDRVAFDVANFYHLVCLTNDIDGVLEDATRRIRVFRQVSRDLNRRGSLRGNRIDTLQADYFVSQLEQFRYVIQAGRHQAFQALRHFVGVPRDKPLLLKQASLPPGISGQDLLHASAAIVRGFLGRPELRQVNLFTKIREAQVEFAKAGWAPNIAILGSYSDVRGNQDSILNEVEGIIASFIVDIPIYDPARRGRLREALGLRQASLAFQRQVEELITLEIEVTAIDCQRALATLFKAARARRIAAEHYQATRQAYTRELSPAGAVVTAIALDMFAKIQHLQARFAYHNARARLRRVTADREAQYGY